MAMLLAIDYDGTIVEHMFPKIGNPVPDALFWLRRFNELGAKLIIWTMRSDAQNEPYLTDAVEYCRQHGVEFWGVNCNPEQHTWTTSRKVYAHHYIDDAAIGCYLMPGKFGPRPMVDWSKIGPEVEKMLLAGKK